MKQVALFRSFAYLKIACCPYERERVYVIKYNYPCLVSKYHILAIIHDGIIHFGPKTGLAPVVPCILRF